MVNVDIDKLSKVVVFLIPVIVFGSICSVVDIWSDGISTMDIAIQIGTIIFGCIFGYGFVFAYDALNFYS